jgi:hypothetical protein
MRRVLLWSTAVALSSIPLAAADRETKVRQDRQQVEAEGYWIYGDLARGIAEAKQSGKPIAVALRCLPCEECVKLDEELIHADPELRRLLDQFVRVRIISTNGLDLSLFQFDTDQSFAMFFVNADGTIYGRFGTRSHRTEWEHDVSYDGLGQALEGALELHRQYPRNQASLAGKRGPNPPVASPERFPSLLEKYTAALNYEGNVVASCIHCHQIGDAERQAYFDRGQVLPDRLLFPYPHPKFTGLILDPRQCATVLSVEENSPASRAGFRAGDRILSLAGQPLISIADVQWVLHQTDPKGAEIPAEVQRGDETLTATLKLPAGWREQDTISWRASSWQLRQLATGGLFLQELTAEERRERGLPDAGMALLVKHVGQYSPHDFAKRAGIRNNDVILEFAGKSDFERETDLLAWSLRHLDRGDVVDVKLRRGDQDRTIQLTLP